MRQNSLQNAFETSFQKALPQRRKTVDGVPMKAEPARATTTKPGATTLGTICACLALGWATLAGALVPAHAEQVPEKGGGQVRLQLSQDKQLTGTVAGMGDESITIKLADGKYQAVAVTRTALNGIKAGDVVQVQTGADGVATIRVIKSGIR
jgi:hypothetical protein